MSTLTRWAGAPLAVVILVLAGCGGGGGKGSGADEEKDISTAVRTGFTTRDVEVKCGQIVTSGFVKRVYGDAATCRKAETPDSSDKPPTGVTVSQTKVDGDKATAHVELSGGDSDGATGTVDVAKEGGDWKVDDLEVDLLRSQFSTGLKQASIPGLESASSKDCLTKEVNGLGDADLQRLAYGAIAESSAATQQLTTLVTKCAPEQADTTTDATSSSSSSSGKVSFLRSKFEEGLTRSARKDGANSTQITCVKKKLRKTISDNEILALIQAGKKTSPELTARVRTAVTEC